MVRGNLKLIANQEQCFDASVVINLSEIKVKREMEYDMKDPEYRG